MPVLWLTRITSREPLQELAYMNLRHLTTSFFQSPSILPSETSQPLICQRKRLVLKNFQLQLGLRQVQLLQQLVSLCNALIVFLIRNLKSDFKCSNLMCRCNSQEGSRHWRQHFLFTETEGARHYEETKSRSLWQTCNSIIWVPPLLWQRWPPHRYRSRPTEQTPLENRHHVPRLPPLPPNLLWRNPREARAIQIPLSLGNFRHARKGRSQSPSSYPTAHHPHQE